MSNLLVMMNLKLDLWFPVGTGFDLVLFCVDLAHLSELLRLKFRLHIWPFGCNFRLFRVLH